jgi:hypothetical protein
MLMYMLLLLMVIAVTVILAFGVHISESFSVFRMHMLQKISRYVDILLLEVCFVSFIHSLIFSCCRDK